MCDHHRVRRTATAAIGSVLATCAVLLVGCGSGSGSSGGGAASADPSPEAAEGLAVAKANGCMACHSVDGRESIGPTWQGLYGSQVELEDGTTVTADDTYLRRAIQQPGDQIVAGFRAVMPERDLDDAEVDSIIDYLRSL